jgi:hypothetical protein
MKAVIKHCYSTDVEDLFEYRPGNSSIFGFPLRFLIGPNDQPYEVSFDVFLCSPNYLLANYPKNSIIFNYHMIIAFEYNFDEILDRVAKYVTSLEEDTWEKLIDKLSRFGKSEFEDVVIM